MHGNLSNHFNNLAVHFLIFTAYRHLQLKRHHSRAVTQVWDYPMNPIWSASEISSNHLVFIYQSFAKGSQEILNRLVKNQRNDKFFVPKILSRYLGIKSWNQASFLNQILILIESDWKSDSLNRKLRLEIWTQLIFERRIWWSINLEWFAGLFVVCWL